MISSLISRIVILFFGTLYPAYSSYKAIRTKNVNEYVRWMMYWIVFALFTTIETFTDIFLSFWFPFYYELKILVVLYLLSPATKGSSILYRKCVHPLLTSREQEIDQYIAKAKEQGYNTMLTLGTKGVNYATTVLMQTAIKGGGGLVNHLRKSYSLIDLSSEKDSFDGRDELDSSSDTYTEIPIRRKMKVSRGSSPRRAVSSGSQVDLYFSGVDPPDYLLSSQQQQVKSEEDLSSGYSSTDPLSSVRASDAMHGSLLRTSSVSSTSRMRTRATTRAEASTTSLTATHSHQVDHDSGCIANNWEESQSDVNDCSPMLNTKDHGNENSKKELSLLAANDLIPPHLRFLFSTLTPEQLVQLISNASDLKSNMGSLNSLNDVQNAELNHVDSSAHSSDLLNTQNAVVNNLDSPVGSLNLLDDVANAELYNLSSSADCSNLLTEVANAVVNDLDNTLSCENSFNHIQKIEEIEECVVKSPVIDISTPKGASIQEKDGVLIKRSKKRHAPPIPDSNRVSVSSDNANFQVFDESKPKESGLIRVLSLSKLSLSSIWQRHKDNVSPSESFVSLRSGDFSSSSASPSEDCFVREMSQSPSTKRRMF